MNSGMNSGGAETSNRSKKLATTVYITEEQQALLKELNRRTRVPIAEYIREGIDLVLSRHSSELPGQMNLLSGPSGERSGGEGLDRNP